MSAVRLRLVGVMLIAALVSSSTVEAARKPHRAKPAKGKKAAPPTAAPQPEPKPEPAPAPAPAPAPTAPPPATTAPAAAAAPAPAPVSAPVSAPKLNIKLTPTRTTTTTTTTKPAPPHSPEGTRCIQCHTTTSWDDVRFAHDRTGFPLVGAHRKVSCKTCHTAGFAKPLADRCAACHRDPHAQEFGTHCEGCHDEESWRTTFNADAHRRTNFPLSGRHALIPCVECHPNVRDRSFSRAALGCMSCHQADYQRTAMTSVDHVAGNFPQSCQSCHLPWRWSPSSFSQHDQCFTISRGPHAGIRCLSCHTSLTGFAVTGQCATMTAACTACHEHQCARTDAIHTNVPGYMCRDRKCWECHRF